MKTTITTTTINVPYLIEDYIKDVLAHGREKDVDFIIAGDKKTHHEASAFCESMQNLYGITVLYMDVENQEQFLATKPTLLNYLPWNCLQRRNVAILNAYARGADIIILIDDDNYIACDDYVGKNQYVGACVETDVYHSESGWYNICAHLKDRQARKFYPRGYSWPERICETAFTIRRGRVRCVVNGGFWLGDPDIDAVTRLSAPIDAVEYVGPEHFALGKNVFSPFNSQNTAICREIVPAYFLCPGIGRFDDIWASYVIERIAWHMGDSVMFGQPLVRQQRNEHDLWIDVAAECEGTKFTPDFCRWLREVTLTSSTYGDCMLELLEGLKQIVDRQSYTMLPYEKRAFFNHFIDGAKIWAKSFDV